MKLAILTFDFPPDIGGVQTYLYEIARRMSEEYDIWIITPVSGQLFDRERLHIVHPKGAHARGYWQALRQIKPERVLVGHVHPQLLLPAFVYGRRAYAAIAHGNDYLAARRRFHWPLVRRLLLFANPLITHTTANAKRLQTLSLPRPEIVLPGTDPKRFYPPAVPSPYPPILLTVGRLVPRKGHDTVLRALPFLLKAFPDLEYHIAGVGPARPQLQQLARELCIENAVHFLGKVPDSELPSVYRQAHVFVMPVREEKEAASLEGFGIVYLEASASGLPVIAGNSGGAVEAIREDETGVLVPPDDQGKLAEMLFTLLKDASLRDRFGVAGRRWVETEMNWNRAASQYNRLLS